MRRCNVVLCVSLRSRLRTFGIWIVGHGLGEGMSFCFRSRDGFALLKDAIPGLLRNKKVSRRQELGDVGEDGQVMIIPFL